MFPEWTPRSTEACRGPLSSQVNRLTLLTFWPPPGDTGTRRPCSAAAARPSPRLWAARRHPEPLEPKKKTHTELDFYSKSSWTDECCIILYIQLFIHFLLVAQGEESFHPLRASAHWGVLQKQTASFMSHLCGPLTHELIMALGCMMWACLCLVNGMLVHTLQTRNNAGE